MLPDDRPAQLRLAQLPKGHRAKCLPFGAGCAEALIEQAGRAGPCVDHRSGAPTGGQCHRQRFDSGSTGPLRFFGIRREFRRSRPVGKTGSRVILPQQFSRSVAENSKVCRLKAALFQKGRGRILTIGKTHTQIPKVLEDKSIRGPVYKRRFLGEDCRSLPSLNSLLGQIPTRTMCMFLETGQALVISTAVEWNEQMTRNQGTGYRQLVFELYAKPNTQTQTHDSHRLHKV